MLTRIPTATLKELLKLSERKEALMARIQEIDREMTRLEHKFEDTPGSALGKGRVTFSTAPQKRRASRRAKKGALKAKIMKALRAAGTKGASIRQLSDKLGVRSANLYVWFNGTGKNVPGLKKIGTAKYRLV
ncbi:MAG: hypothetical protein M3R29_05975 [Verrucomicrobiota bacterium]|nr:hypothetical protein [Verrucomicrobiota bacterium]